MQKDLLVKKAQENGINPKAETICFFAGCMDDKGNAFTVNRGGKPGFKVISSMLLLKLLAELMLDDKDVEKITNQATEKTVLKARAMLQVLADTIDKDQD